VGSERIKAGHLAEKYNLGRGRRYNASVKQVRLEDTAMALTDIELEQLLRAGAIKLEITGGIPTWETSPSSRHQWTVQFIGSSIKPIQEADGVCECEYLADVYIRFADGSIKRPDRSIFCQRPPLQDEALTIIPQAVIEVISPGYEYKEHCAQPAILPGAGRRRYWRG
jgi:Uma2 family endonuclease